MEGFKKQLRYQIQDSKKAFIIFWIIIILVDITGYFINYYSGGSFGMMNNEPGVSRINVAGSNVVSISIFLIVYNMIMYYEGFPTAIGFSSTRRDFFKGVLAHNLLLCLGMAIVQGILMKIDPFFVNLIGANPMVSFGGINLLRANVVTISFSLFLYFIMFSAAFNLLGSLLYKYTYKMWFGIAAIFIVIGNIGSLRVNILPALEKIFISSSIMADLIETVIIATLFYAASWFVIRKMRVRAGK